MWRKCELERTAYRDSVQLEDLHRRFRSGMAEDGSELQDYWLSLWLPLRLQAVHIREPHRRFSKLEFGPFLHEGAFFPKSCAYPAVTLL
jgi:hypothetical protein